MISIVTFFVFTLVGVSILLLIFMHFLLIKLNDVKLFTYRFKQQIDANLQNEVKMSKSRTKKLKIEILAKIEEVAKEKNDEELLINDKIIETNKDYVFMMGELDGKQGLKVWKKKGKTVDKIYDIQKKIFQ